MTEQMTAYFHGNTPVSSEMSGGDSKQALCKQVYGGVQSRYADLIARAKTLQTGERQITQRPSSVLYCVHVGLIKEGSFY